MTKDDEIDYMRGKTMTAKDESSRDEIRQYLSETNIALAIKYCRFKKIDSVSFKINYDPSIRGDKEESSKRIRLVMPREVITFSKSQLESTQPLTWTPDDCVEMIVEFTKEEMDKLK